MDLWPNLHELNSIRGPKEILQEQDEWLRKKTNEMLYLAITEAIDILDILESQFVFNVHLKGRYLEQYSYRLLQFRHGITMYPVTIKLDSDIEPIDVDGVRHTGDYKEYIIQSQEVFEEFFRTLVNTSQVKGVISAILSLSR